MLSLLSRIILLADRPDLAAAWAELHWREWGTEPGREELSWWIADARRALHRERVPVAFLTLGADDTVLGGVSLHPFDLEERRDRSPWIVGMIVRPELRGQGIGQALIAALETWAKQAGIGRLWVCTESANRAVAFYRRCGYEFVEELTARGERITVLAKLLMSNSI